MTGLDHVNLIRTREQWPGHVLKALHALLPNECMIQYFHFRNCTSGTRICKDCIWPITHKVDHLDNSGDIRQLPCVLLDTMDPASGTFRKTYHWRNGRSAASQS